MGAVSCDCSRSLSDFRCLRTAPLKSLFTLSILLCGLIATTSAQAGEVAITFDDLPLFGGRFPAREEQTVTTRLLSGFRRHGWQVTGFVNEIQLEGAARDRRIGLLRQWLDAGMNLGNHGYSHLSLTRTPLEAYIMDVARGGLVTGELLSERGRSERWFRHPYLETGPTLDVRTRFERWLDEHGYRVAPVSMENSDWEFAEPYDDAVQRHDARQARQIRKAYLAYTGHAVRWYRDAAINLLGREPAFILLLHASRLNAACLDGLARILSSNRLTPVTLDQAITDPAYAIADRYAGPDGDEWVTRWSMALEKEIPGDALPDVPDEIAALDANLEAADPDPEAPPAPTPSP